MYERFIYVQAIESENIKGIKKFPKPSPFSS